MAKKKSPSKKHTPDVEEKMDSAIGKTEQWLQDNTKPLLIALIVAVLVVGGYFGYKYLIQEPRMERASDAMFVAEQLYAQEDYEAALNGDGVNEGFLDIVSSYGSTPQGRLAAHYAGICYMKAGDYDNALTYLKKYKHTKGVPAILVNAQNSGLQGDAYVQKGDYRKASEMYDKAAQTGDNILVTPYYLKKYAEVNEKLGNIQTAIDACKRIRDYYGNSMEAREIDKMLGRLEQK